TIGAHAKTASNNTFVAPVTVGDGAATGAGSVIRRDVPPGALAVTSGPQRHFDAWVQHRRAGTAQAEAAEKATDEAARETTRKAVSESTGSPDGGTPDPDVGDAPAGG
ncbi:MAG: bifunctional UDP-N-acetylglucosamine diphosphorylase/glucosamine-1-phosphate N-acetyltransferase GlmU, partial [Propionibacteriales bacterium]|nr:bifunctional UDP-N-acetylglucosamine diphosphorylase/glucosamine-1-phosphate N-acetyltransferase GlmU [Propionibacteriales bacterium]